MSIKVLEEYFENNNEIYDNIFRLNRQFGYEDREEFRDDIIFLSDIYVRKILEYKRKRLTQEEFRDELIELYKCCIITNFEEPIEACHIKPISENGEYIISNGLLLNRDLHQLFDNFTFTISHKDGKIIVDESKINKKIIINNYNGNYVDKEIIELCKESLEWHNNKFFNR
jgi:hypothetical protein